mmetsp:Transcript_27635/g.68317  ORF Transcript_27635/g.68317 Transcript_27635/m.68317 type:complete len:223 (-) Transcript_27635:987-1655(-)
MCSFPSEYLVDAHQFVPIPIVALRQAVWHRHVRAHPKPPLHSRVAHVCRGHVGVDLGERDVQIEFEGKKHTRNEHSHDGEGRILEVRQLSLHRPELDTPPNPAARGGRLPTNCLPVGRLYVLEVVRSCRVRNVDTFPEDDQGVAHEQVRDVPREGLINAPPLERRVRHFVNRALNVVVLIERRLRVLAFLAVANVARDGLVARLGELPLPPPRHPLRLPFVR